MVKIPILTIIIFVLMVSTLSCSNEPDPVDLPLEGEVTELASEFIGKMAEEDYISAVAFFSFEMKQSMSKRRLEQTWENILKETGSYRGEIEKYIEPLEEHDAVVVNIITEFARGPYNIRVVFNSDNRITGLRFHSVD